MTSAQSHDDGPFTGRDPGGILAPRLRVFEAVARTEHITRAAEELGLPQPTVSRALARIQRELGLALIERTGRGVRLTRAGRTLLPYVRRALKELAAGGAQLTDPDTGTVTLAFLPTLGAEVVPSLIRAFRADHPQVRFSLRQEVWGSAVRSLREGGVDLALTSPVPTERGLSVRVLHTQPLVLVVPAGHPLARAEETPISAVGTDQLIALNRGRGIRHLTDGLFHRAGLEPRIAFETDEVGTVRGLVAAGLGVAVLAARPHSPLPGTVELRITDPGAERSIGVVWHPYEGEPATVASFRAFVLAEGERLVAGGLA
ncbi:DNA-binding transcriptional LysR family regulator [Murinocardiopsis flavida]|uniref:DNA-binding transcriptional LysR family regulator n=1 Tax=Murinocardiopsis flavida TaxID=645275 RepID=A0A2P8D506_9ACTN|nr:LysR family transcriptional regulator [Murinocardiopsis flavida]PSK92297.1 DNA-binding transcriptional LysR family regulator [Murinocardiopsis flavida]